MGALLRPDGQHDNSAVVLTVEEAYTGAEKLA